MSTITATNASSGALERSSSSSVGLFRRIVAATVVSRVRAAKLRRAECQLESLDDRLLKDLDIGRSENQPGRSLRA